MNSLDTLNRLAAVLILFVLLTLGVFGCVALHSTVVAAHALQGTADLRDFDRKTSALQMGMAAFALLGVCTKLALIYTRRVYRRRADAEVRRHVESLERAALTDSLTGLGNHRAFYEQFEREVARARRHNLALSLVLMDVDDFKTLNDTRGHKHGDDILVAVAQALRGSRAEDVAYRIGGDEFAMLLVETDSDGARTAGARLQQRVRNLIAPVTVSVGVCTAVRDHDQHDLYECADAALYAAKSNGRDAVVCYEDVERDAVVFSNKKASALRALLDLPRVDVAFQPIWSLAESHVFGLEALCRPPSDCGLSGPQEAFDVAERIRRTAELDELCVRSVFHAARTLPPDVFLFVNVAPDSLSHPLLAPQRWLQLIARAGLRPSQVVIELTERRISNPEHVLRMLEALRAEGVSIALDDTGSGYAGLNLLTQAPFDFVKIDRSIVTGAPDNQRTRAVLAGIIAIAREAGSFVIAEGIENMQHLQFLRELQYQRHDLSFGVHGAQGYLLGRPRIGDPRLEPFLQYASLLDADSYESETGTLLLEASLSS
ncbi:MAG TPA: bifunctional diguanylate cyclase/phosphodiesterase [Candidatus Baltobacteraceae bacterium]|nr:bifunctional diguanylate cyclase/phosphodiesterase [Candidatus Baltobacteraceae bacterium]